MTSKITAGLATWTAVATLATCAVALQPANIKKVTLNGLDITLDNQTGAILQLDYPGPGTLLDADAAEAGLVDVAYPIEQFEPLRLAARHSRDAVIEESPGRVVIRLGELGPSRDNFSIEGQVATTVTLQADPDGCSLILSCEIENRSPRAVRQVIFPELRGLVPIAGPDHTILKSCGFGSAPFRELVVPEADQWYAQNSSTVEHKSGGMFSTMWGRWLDLGGLTGGLSLFPQRWGWDCAHHHGRSAAPSHGQAADTLRASGRSQTWREVDQRQLGVDTASQWLGQGYRTVPTMGALESQSAVCRAATHSRRFGIPHVVDVPEPGAGPNRCRVAVQRLARAGGRGPGPRPVRDGHVVLATGVRRVAAVSVSPFGDGSRVAGRGRSMPEDWCQYGPVHQCAAGRPEVRRSLWTQDSRQQWLDLSHRDDPTLESTLRHGLLVRPSGTIQSSVAG